MAVALSTEHITPRAADAPLNVTNLRANLVLARRYQLLQLLGRGGQSAVWLAHDRVTGQQVAVKALPRREGAEAARVRREVAALRRLRMPGVACLLDEGVEGDLAFVVLERVPGSAFPGTAIPAAWHTLSPLVRSLLTTLSAVHAEGVIHRDLKPSNVMVTPSGEPVLLDFGVSWGSLEGAITRRGEILGTPGYLAPEQVLGDPVTPASDLYALGVMLYEALSGSLPFEGVTTQAILFARCFRPAPPLRARAPAVPLGVAAVVDRLLARAPDARYRDAAQVLAALDGAAERRSDTQPWRGPREPLDVALSLLRRDQGLALCGPPGSGRSRCLDELAEALAADGRRVFRVEALPGPYASLDGTFDLLRHMPDADLAAVSTALRDALRSALDGGAALLVDDFEQVDPWSARLIVEATAAGPVAIACAAAGSAPPSLPQQALRPLSMEVLSGFISGHERVLHLNTDATRALFARTGGIVKTVQHELERWVRDGIGARDGDRVRVTREGLARIEATLRHTPPGTLVPPDATPSSRHADLLRWICIGWPTTTVPLLQSVTGDARWSIEAELEAMRVRGLVAPESSGLIVPRVNPLREGDAPRDDDRHRHQRIAAALDPGTEGRLRHLLAALSPVASAAALDAVMEEAVVLARRRAAEGSLALAMIALHEALDAQRRWGPAHAVRPAPILDLLRTWTLIALAEATPRALDRALDQIALASDHPMLAGHRALESLEQLLRGALALRRAPERVQRLVEPLRDNADPGVRRAARDLLLRSMGTGPAASREALLELWRPPRDGGRCAATSADASVWCTWVGRERVHEGRPRDAAVAFAEAARLAPWESERIAALLAGAEALLSMGSLDAARSEAEEARQRAARCRHAHHEAMAEWLLRAVMLAEGQRVAPDWELLEVVAFLDEPELAAHVVETESAHAERIGMLREAGRIRASLAHTAAVPEDHATERGDRGP
jgi:hypothetical protein